MVMMMLVVVVIMLLRDIIVHIFLDNQGFERQGLFFLRMRRGAQRSRLSCGLLLVAHLPGHLRS